MHIGLREGYKDLLPDQISLPNGAAQFQRHGLFQVRFFFISSSKVTTAKLELKDRLIDVCIFPASYVAYLQTKLLGSKW